MTILGYTLSSNKPIYASFCSRFLIISQWSSPKFSPSIHSLGRSPHLCPQCYNVVSPVPKPADYARLLWSSGISSCNAAWPWHPPRFYRWALPSSARLPAGVSWRRPGRWSWGSIRYMILYIYCIYIYNEHDNDDADDATAATTTAATTTSNNNHNHTINAL